ncbi:sulfite exporter TauE/SafE family protein [Sulfurimonas sp.]
MHDYLLYALITFIISSLFSMAGAGGAIALIPIFHFLGIDFTVAKAIGLFSGASSTITSSILNIKKKAINYKNVLPIASMMLIFSPFGAYCSSFINKDIVKFVFMILLFYSATMMLFTKKKALLHNNSKSLFFIVGGSVGFVAGLLGVGGGNILIPLLTFLGYEPKKIAVAVSFIVPFSALSSFITYASYISLDWKLLFVVAISAIVGGYVGNNLMHYKLKEVYIKKLMAFFLYLLGLKLLWHFVA